MSDPVAETARPSGQPEIEQASINFALLTYDELRKDRRGKRKMMNDIALNIAREKLGIDLPVALPVTDADGSLWELNIWASLTLQRRAWPAQEGPNGD